MSPEIGPKSLVTFVKRAHVNWSVVHQLMVRKDSYYDQCTHGLSDCDKIATVKIKKPAFRALVLRQSVRPLF